MNKKTCTPHRLLMALCLGALSLSAKAADVTVVPPSGGGFAVRDTGNSTDRFRVNESGSVLIPGLNGQPQQGALTCFNSATGQFGPCSAGRADQRLVWAITGTSTSILQRRWSMGQRHLGHGLRLASA